APSLSDIDGDLCQARRGRVAFGCSCLADRGRPRMTTLSQRLDDYLAVRRSLGFDLSFEERMLRVFARLADREAADHITVDLFLRWKATFGTANNNTWARRLGMVRAFAAWLKGYDERTEVPPQGLIVGKWHRSRPYIYSDNEVATIVAQAAKLPSRY